MAKVSVAFLIASSPRFPSCGGVPARAGWFFGSDVGVSSCVAPPPRQASPATPPGEGNVFVLCQASPDIRRSSSMRSKTLNSPASLPCFSQGENSTPANTHSPNGATHPSPGQRPGNHDTNGWKALKGRPKGSSSVGGCWRWLALGSPLQE